METQEVEWGFLHHYKEIFRGDKTSGFRAASAFMLGRWQDYREVRMCIQAEAASSLSPRVRQKPERATQLQVPYIDLDIENGIMRNSLENKSIDICIPSSPFNPPNFVITT